MKDIGYFIFGNDKDGNPIQSQSVKGFETEPSKQNATEMILAARRKFHRQHPAGHCYEHAVDLTTPALRAINMAGFDMTELVDIVGTAGGSLG